MQKTRPNPIICAIDTTDIEKAKQLAGQIKPYVGAIKLGLEFFTYNGTAGVKALEATGIPIFLDLKFHDIPNTVAGAIRALSELDVFMTTVHISGGKAMMEAAKSAAADLPNRPMVVGVTALTSLDAQDLASLGVKDSMEDHVKRLADMAQAAGLDGVVCSPHEIELLRNHCGNDFILVVPGIRPEGSATGDQKRVMTPKQALEKGADYLVIGRPITESTDPKKKAQEILQSLGGDPNETR